MELLIRIVDAGSLSAAARASGCSLATVVRSLAALEDHLGARLVNRTTRRLSLTDAGSDYLARARHIVRLVDEAQTSAASATLGARGLLRVSAPQQFGRLHVAPVVQSLLQQAPDLAVELLLSDRNVNLLEEGVDVAVRIGELQDSSLVAVQVGRVRQVICASPAYLQRCGQPDTLADLARHECLRFMAHRHATWGFGAAATAAKGRLACNSVETLMQAAIEGHGIVCLLSYQVAVPLASGALVEVLAQEAPPPLPVRVVYPHARLLPAKVHAFRDAMVARRAQLDFAQPVSSAATHRDRTPAKSALATSQAR